jgi:hypothetical protein
MSCGIPVVLLVYWGVFGGPLLGPESLGIWLDVILIFLMDVKGVAKILLCSVGIEKLFRIALKLEGIFTEHHGRTR